MNMLLFAAGLLALFVSQSVGQALNEDENSELEGPIHSIVRRSYPTNTGHHSAEVHPSGEVYPTGGTHTGGPVYKGGAVHPSGGAHKGGSVHPAGVGESRDHGYSRHVTQPHYFAFPTRYRGYIANYYYPEFEYANVPSGYATNYYELPVSGKFGGNTGFGTFGNNFGFGGGRAIGGQGLNFAFSGGRGGSGFGAQGRNSAFGRGRAFGGQGSGFAFGGGRAFGGQRANFAFGRKSGQIAFPGKW